MILKTPPMGWNSWNTFEKNISADLVKETADAMIETGLRDAGYEYIVLDDCWSLMDRSPEGKLVADPEKFPDGMKAVSDLVHEKGFKFGMYSCSGTKTCARYPSSFEHEFVDAATFAEWGVDYLKYDYCNKPRIDGDLLYKRMGLALANCGRDIVFSACSWGADDTAKWIKSTGAHLWRSTGDIFDSWQSIKNLALQQIELQPYNGVGCFNDMDMLVVGMHGEGNVGIKGCTDEEYRTHFSLWSMLNSPLIIGCDVRNMSPSTKEILTNKEVIAINQDLAGRQPYLILNWNQNQLVWVKLLENGDYAIGLFNLGDDTSHMDFYWWDMGLCSAAGYGFALRDLWKHEDMGVYREGLGINVPGHGCLMLRAKLVKDMKGAKLY